MRFYVARIRDNGREGIGSDCWFAEYASLTNLIRYGFRHVPMAGDYNVYTSVKHSYAPEDERFICTLRMDGNGHTSRVASREHARICIAWRGDCSCLPAKV
jgi:hypothetical protein